MAHLGSKTIVEIYGSLETGTCNLEEIKVYDEETDESTYRYEIRRWWYGSFTVVCAWESPTPIAFEVEDDPSA